MIGFDGVYRDALLSDRYSDKSPTWEVLLRAAQEGTKLTLELAVRVPEGGFNDVDDSGSAWIGVPQASTNADVQQISSGGMGYWIVVPRRILVAGGSDKTFVRVTGILTVREVDTARPEEFHLSQVSVKFPPGISDPDRCSTVGAIDNTQTEVAAAQELAANHDLYQTIKANGIAAPRQWWAIKMKAYGDGGDLVRYACGPWLYR